MKTDNTVTIKDAIKLFGPAWIVMMADVDAASVLTGVADGQEYGYRLIWLLLLLTLPLFLIQDAAGRIGAVNNGKGLGSLIRGKFSTSLALLSSIPMFGVDVFTYVVEYSGIAVGSLILGIPIYVSLPIFFLIHLAIILTKKYAKAEKILLGISFILMISFIIQAGLRGIVPNQQIFYLSSSPSFIFIVAANIGAVIMPFMLFYQASATAYKYIDVNSSSEVKVKWSSYETIIGAIVSEALMVAIELATTGISKSVDPLNYEQISQALSIVSGNLSPYIFGIGLISAGFLALIVESFGSAWGTLESLNKYDPFDGKSHKNLVWLYLTESVPALIVVMIFSNNFDKIVNFVLTLMSISPIIALIPAFFIGIVVGDKKIMGDNAYGKTRLIIYWVTMALIGISGIISLIY